MAALFHDHHGELVRLALLMVGDLPTAEDVVQDVYASLHRGNRAQRVEAMLPYVRAAVLNGCRSVLRRRSIARRIGITREDQPTSAESAESEVILSEDRREVLAALLMLMYDGASGPVSGWIDHGSLRHLPVDHPEPWLGFTAW